MINYLYITFITILYFNFNVNTPNDPLILLSFVYKYIIFSDHYNG